MRALAPRSAAQAATFAACPPGASLVAAAASSPGASRESSRTITSRSRSPRVHTTTVGLSRGRRGQAKRTAALLHVRRGARRIRGRRGGPPSSPASGGPPHAGRARRLRGRAVLSGDAGERGRRTRLASSGGVEAPESQGTLDGQQVDVRVAEVERLTDELDGLRLEQEL